jgi:hypothetical protein
MEEREAHSVERDAPTMKKIVPPISQTANRSVEPPSNRGGNR